MEYPTSSPGNIDLHQFLIPALIYSEDINPKHIFHLVLGIMKTVQCTVYTSQKYIKYTFKWKIYDHLEELNKCMFDAWRMAYSILTVDNSIFPFFYFAELQKYPLQQWTDSIVCRLTF